MAYGALSLSPKSNAVQAFRVRQLDNFTWGLCFCALTGFTHFEGLAVKSKFCSGYIRDMSGTQIPPSQTRLDPVQETQKQRKTPNPLSFSYEQ